MKLELTEEEEKALKDMVKHWMEEEFTAPEHWSQEQWSIIQKLGIKLDEYTNKYREEFEEKARNN